MKTLSPTTRCWNDVTEIWRILTQGDVGRRHDTQMILSLHNEDEEHLDISSLLQCSNDSLEWNANPGCTVPILLVNTVLIFGSRSSNMSNSKSYGPHDPRKDGQCFWNQIIGCVREYHEHLNKAMK